MPIMLLGMLGLVLSVACGESGVVDSPDTRAPQGDTPERSVIALAQVVDGGEPAALLDEPLTGISLESGQSWERPLALEGLERHSVVLHFEGQEPRLLSGAVGSSTLAPLRVVALDHGRLEATLLPTSADVRLVVRALSGSTRPTRLSIRRWASQKLTPLLSEEMLSRGKPDSAGTGEVPAAHRLESGLDSRPGWVLSQGDELALAVQVPAHATRLSIAAAQPRYESFPGSLPELSVRWLDQAGETRTLARLSVLSSAHRWHELLINVGALAGHSGTLLLGSVRAVESNDRSVEPPGDLLVAVPELLCERGRRRPNLVLISLDTTRPDHLGVYGYERDTSPRIDALAERSVVFDRAASVSAYTLPAHATMLTGLHPLGHGVVHPGHALDADSLPLLARLLGEQGWATRAFTGGGYLSADYGFAVGFSAYGQLDPMRGLTKLDRQWYSQQPRGELELEALDAQNWPNVLDWVTERRNVPFFLFLQTFAIHDYRPTGEQRGRFGGPKVGSGPTPMLPLDHQLEQPYAVSEREQLVSLYDEAIAETDVQLGRLFDLLDELGIGEDTIVVITSDHGETIGEHGRGDVGIVGHNFGLWEEQIAVPLILSVPGHSPGRRPEHVSLLDLAPTLLELLEQPIPAAMQGRSWVSWLAGAPDAIGPSPVLLDLASNVARQRAIYSGRLKLVLGETDARVFLPVPVERALYDLQTDPGEQHDLSAEYPELVERLVSELRNLVWRMASTGESPLRVELDDESRRQLEQLGYLR
jgi:arylsulfatase A-like enzyme